MHLAKSEHFEVILCQHITQQHEFVWLFITFHCAQCNQHEPNSGRILRVVGGKPRFQI